MDLNFGLNAISFGIIGLISEYLDKNFSKDNRITVMFLTCVLTCIAETIIYVLQILFCGASVLVLQFIKIVCIETIYNSLIIAIIYPAFLAFGEKIENDFTENSFLKF